MAVRDCPANAPVDAKICHLSKHGGRDLLVEIGACYATALYYEVSFVVPSREFGRNDIVFVCSGSEGAAGRCGKEV